MATEPSDCEQEPAYYNSVLEQVMLAEDKEAKGYRRCECSCHSPMLGLHVDHCIPCCENGWKKPFRLDPED